MEQIKTPLVSVVMSVYNGEKYIREAVDSVLEQTFTDFEFIILDNGSSDSTAKIIDSYEDSRIRFIRNGINLGISDSLNKGIDVSKGKYIARLDADDVCYSDRFEKQVRYLDKHQNICLCAGRHTIVIGEKEKKTRIQKGLNSKQLRFIQFFMNQISHSSVMMRREVFDRYSLRYKDEYSGVQDYALWMEMMKYGDMAVLKDRLVKYRIHDTNLSKDTDMMRHDEMRIQDELYQHMEVVEDVRDYFIRAIRGSMETAEDICKLGVLLTAYYKKCGLNLTDGDSRDLLEYTYYALLMKYFSRGYVVYQFAVKSRVFRFHSEWRWKALIRSLLKKGIR